MDEQTSLLTAERRNRIAELVARQGVVRVGELSDLFQVSEVTIRNDLDLLARQGLVVRDRGGAVAHTRAGLAVAFEQRAALNQEEKRRIGRAAAQLVEPGDTIIMDAGSTMLEMARCLGNVAPLTVVTNALNVATELGSFAGIQVVLVGGSLDRTTISAVGPHAIRDFAEFVVTKVFLGVHAIDPLAGLTDCSIEIAEVKRSLIGDARQVTLLADSGKWGRVGLVKVAPLSAVHTIVSDAGLDAEAQAFVRRLGIELILA